MSPCKQKLNLFNMPRVEVDEETNCPKVSAISRNPKKGYQRPHKMDM